MESWLLEALKQGGLFALAIAALWMLDRVWKDRLADERRNSAQIKEMWEQTSKALENNTRLVSAFMERFELQQPASSRRKTVPVSQANPKEEDGPDPQGG